VCMCLGLCYTLSHLFQIMALPKYDGVLSNLDNDFAYIISRAYF
jgi:hypothetical protein